jgi:hypothetical protein
MFDNRYLDANGNWTYQGSINACQDAARNGQILSSQQANESWASFQERQNAYEAERRRLSGG